MALDVATLRSLFRNLQLWEALYESDGVSTITGPDGHTYHLVDIRYLYDCRHWLWYRQAQAIELCLYENMIERKAAETMGILPTNPVAVYANEGLKELLRMAEAGELMRYRMEAA